MNCASVRDTVALKDAMLSIGAFLESAGTRRNDNNSPNLINLKIISNLEETRRMTHLKLVKS
jgi:hypothetical protein